MTRCAVVLLLCFLSASFSITLCIVAFSVAMPRVWNSLPVTLTAQN